MTTSQRTRRRDREQDDQAVDLGQDLHYCEVLSGTFHGSASSWKIVELVFFRKPVAAPKGQKLQSNIGDVEVAIHLVLYCTWRREKGRKCGRIYMLVGLDGISFHHLTSDGHEFTAKVLGMAGGKESSDETW